MYLRTIDIFANIFLPVFLGILIYLFPDQFDHIKLIRNQVPDGLWAYAFSSSIFIVWNRQISWIWLVAVVVVCIFCEVLQFAEVIPGVADIWDIAAYFLFLFFSLLTNNFLKPKYTQK